MEQPIREILAKNTNANIAARNFIHFQVYQSIVAEVAQVRIDQKD